MVVLLVMSSLGDVTTNSIVSIVVALPVRITFAITAAFLPGDNAIIFANVNESLRFQTFKYIQYSLAFKKSKGSLTLAKIKA